MRILSLRFKNLNSLAGEWKIDFTNSEYVSSGIFAITGPTGAGKSTILDAICLALYGRTPRLGKISSNAGEIMTRQTGEYFSEVEFVSDMGHYRCTWSQRRADKKPEGKIQSPKHEIVDVKTGIPLESKQARVQQKVVDVIGLDYQQFTRSILLAQGEFATFLDAKSEERAPILEKITGTEIYGKISIKVHERFVRENATLDDLTSKANSIEIITPEQADAFREEMLQHEKEIADLSTHYKNLETAAAWLETLATLKTEISQLQEQQTALVGQKENAKNDLDSLCFARKARDLEGIYSGLSALRTQQDSDTAEKKSCMEHLEGFYAAYKNALEKFRFAQQKQDVAIQEKLKDEGIIKLVRELDTRIQETKRNRNEREEEKHQSEGEIEKYNNACLSAELKVKVIQQELSASIAYLESHTADKKLIESLSGIESFFRQIKIILETAENKKTELSDIEKILSDAEQSVLLRNKGRDIFTNKEERAIAEADRIKKEFSDIAGGRDIAGIRALTDTVKDNHDRLRMLLDLVSRIREDTADCNRCIENITTVLAERTNEMQWNLQLQKDEGPIAQLVKLAEEKLLLQVRVKSLENEREKLLEGTPCPLCGSIDHPWCTGVVPGQDDTQQELTTHKKTLEELHKNIRQSEVKLATFDAEIKGHESVRENLGQKIKIATAELQRGCDDLGLVNPGVDLEPVIAAALDECTTKLEKTREILNHAEEKDREIRLAENLVNREKSALAGAQSDYEKTLTYRDTIIGNKNRIISEIATCDENYRRQNEAILNALQEYDDILIFSTNKMPEQILTELTQRRDAYAANLMRKQELDTSQQQIMAEVDRNLSLKSGEETRHKKVSEILSVIYEDLKTFSAKRHELYEEKDPVAEETRLALQVEQAERELSTANEAKNISDKQKSSCEDQILAFTEKITGRIPVLQEKEREFFNHLTGSGFTDENQFISARLPSDKLSELEQLETYLVHEETRISTSLREKTLKLVAEQKRVLTTATREDLMSDIENQKNRITGLHIDIGRLKTNIEQYNAQVAKYQALIEEITQQKKECGKWQKLHDLIGSGDGKKFRIFAQGLTFETLVVQANRHLRIMSNRYLLVRNKVSPLDLDIMDNYQAGEIRSTKNLSGGERFLVSLALALGLSGMASDKVRIDSLFLDEGFGTLDEDTLETALETLSSLQREGKTIGIISHVSALKERIAVQIQVEMIGGGRSRLLGPGCSGPR